MGGYFIFTPSYKLEIRSSLNAWKTPIFEVTFAVYSFLDTLEHGGEKRHEQSQLPTKEY